MEMSENGSEPSLEVIARTEAEILDIISSQEKEEALHDTHGMSLTEFENLLKLEILDLARQMKVVPKASGKETDQEKLNILKRQKFAVWFLWDGLNVIRVERGLVANIYIHTSGKDIIHNRDIWQMLKSVLNKCHNREGGLIESTELELRSKLLEWKMNTTDLRKMLKQVIVVDNKEEEFDLLPKYRILAEESEIYQVKLTDRKTGISAVGKGNIKYRNQIDWGTKLELSRKVREFEFSQERLGNENQN